MSWNSSPWNTVVWSIPGGGDEPPPPPPPPPPSSISVTSSSFNVIAAPVVGEDPIPAPAEGAGSEVQVRILNRARKWKATITDYQYVEWVRNLWGENQFTLVVPNLIEGVRNEAVRYLREHNFVYLLYRADTSDPTSWFAPEFLGVIEYVRHYVDAGGEDVCEVRGESILKRRLVVPVDAGSDKDEVIGTAETILISRVNRAFGTAASVARRSDLIFFEPDQGRGGTIHWVAKYDNLLERLGHYARAANLGFELIPDTFGNITPSDVQGYKLRFIPGVDRSINQTTRTPVIFSTDMVNIESQEVEISSLGRPNMAYMRGAVEIVPVHNGKHANSDVVFDPVDPTAISFNGSQRVVIPPATGSMKGLTASTVEGWVRPTAHTEFSSLYFESRAADTLSRFNLFIDATGHLTLWMRVNDGVQTVFTSSFTLNLNVWSWVAAQWNAADNVVTLRFYDLTGRQQVDSFEFSGLAGMVNTTPLEISLGTTLIGHMARWRLWSTILSESDLNKASVLLFAPPEIPGLLHDWRMDDGDGIWVTDYKQTAHGYLFPGGEWVAGPDFDIGAQVNTIRKEVSWDESGIAEGEELSQLALARFRELGPKITIQIEVQATGSYRYRFHYDLGDLVTWRSLEWGYTTTQKIVQFELRASAGETPSIKISMGAPSYQYPVIANREIKELSTVLRR